MIPAPPDRYQVMTNDRRYPVVAFGDDGTPLIYDDEIGRLAYIDDLPGGGHDAYLRDTGGLLPPVAAEPGWYALIVTHGKDATNAERLPVVAWRAEESVYQNGRATVLAWTETGRNTPIDVKEYVKQVGDARSEDGPMEVVGYFHPVRSPEKDYLVTDARKSHLELERQRVEARAKQKAAGTS